MGYNAVPNLFLAPGDALPEAVPQGLGGVSGGSAIGAWPGPAAKPERRRRMRSSLGCSIAPALGACEGSELRHLRVIGGGGAARAVRPAHVAQRHVTTPWAAEPEELAACLRRLGANTLEMVVVKMVTHEQWGLNEEFTKNGTIVPVTTMKGERGCRSATSMQRAQAQLIAWHVLGWRPVPRGGGSRYLYLRPKNEWPWETPRIAWKSRLVEAKRQGPNEGTMWPNPRLTRNQLRVSSALSTQPMDNWPIRQVSANTPGVSAPHARSTSQEKEKKEEKTFSREVAPDARHPEHPRPRYEFHVRPRSGPGTPQRLVDVLTELLRREERNTKTNWFLLLGRTPGEVSAEAVVHFGRIIQAEYRGIDTHGAIRAALSRAFVEREWAILDGTAAVTRARVLATMEAVERTAALLAASGELDKADASGDVELRDLFQRVVQGSDEYELLVAACNAVENERRKRQLEADEAELALQAIREVDDRLAAQRVAEAGLLTLETHPARAPGLMARLRDACTTAESTLVSLRQRQPPPAKRGDREGLVRFVAGLAAIGDAEGQRASLGDAAAAVASANEAFDELKAKRALTSREVEEVGALLDACELAASAVLSPAGLTMTEAAPTLPAPCVATPAVPSGVDQPGVPEPAVEPEPPREQPSASSQTHHADSRTGLPPEGPLGTLRRSTAQRAHLAGSVQAGAASPVQESTCLAADALSVPEEPAVEGSPILSRAASTLVRLLRRCFPTFGRAGVTGATEGRDDLSEARVPDADHASPSIPTNP